MRFSTRGEYALRSIVNLAIHHPAQKNLREISIEEGISKKYLERLFCELKKVGIIKSRRGKKGGYILADNPKNIAIGKIIECTEGPITIKCYGAECKMLCQCRSSFVWIKLGKQIKKTLYSIKLSDLIK